MEIISHRGLGFSYPENSHVAIGSAMAAGFPVETDVRMTGDMIPVISHDPDCGRLFGKDVVIKNSSFHELGKLYHKDATLGINTFYKVCYLVKHFGRQHNAIHVKEVEKEKIGKIIEMIKSFQIESNVFLYAVDEDTLKLVKIARGMDKKIKVAIHMPQNSPLFRKKFMKMCDVLWVDELDAAWYSKEMVEEAHGMGKEIIAMSPELLKKTELPQIRKRGLEIMNMGFDCICTDYPQELDSYLKEKRK